MTKKMQSYSTQFKAEAVKKIADKNGNLNVTARQLAIAMQTSHSLISVVQFHILIIILTQNALSPNLHLSSRPSIFPNIVYLGHIYK